MKKTTPPAYDPGPGPRRGERARSASESAGRPLAEAPLVEIDGPVKFSGPAPVQFATPPVFVNDRGFVTDLATVVAMKLGLTPEFGVGNSGGGGGLMGVVQSGTGNTYVVTLYPNGPGFPPGGDVTVKVPQIAESEQIPQGTWLDSIGKYKDGYWCQPSVWLDSSPTASGGGPSS